MTLRFIKTEMQQAWGCPAVGNFIFGGAGSGLYLTHFLFRYISGLPADPRTALILNLSALVLVGLGFFCVSTEIGRPGRSLHACRHPRASWISREALAGILLLAAGTLDIVIPHPLLAGCAGLAAMGFIVSQGFIVYSARAVIAWHRTAIPLVFITSGLYAGMGILVMFLSSGTPPLHLGIGTATLSALSMTAWAGYLFLSPGPRFIAATRRLRRPPSHMAVILAHTIPPALIGIAAWADPSTAYDTGIQTTHLLAGGIMFVGGALPKIQIIRKTGYLREVTL